MISISIRNISNHYDVIFASSIVCVLFILLFPIPSILIDLLLSVSITFSILILITVLFLHKPLDLNSFPSILLLSTMLRLALNIASTRLILANGNNGTDAAGYIIESFGKFVMQGSTVIGLTVFSILTIINFIVITKGSGRIAEVSARFSLDAMPGKQMSIDADLAAGIINEDIAKKRRSELEDESTFFGAMDGASKFVRGDAIAGILITFINFIGGMIIGIITRGMGFSDAVSTYTILTIGDGLVSQIPALIISIASGLLVTKSGLVGSTEHAIFSQIGRYPRAIALTSFFLFCIGLIPGMPFLPFFVVSILMFGLAYMAFTKKTDVELQKDLIKKPEQNAEETTQKVLHIDNIKLELGSNLLVFASKENKNSISNNIQHLRSQIIDELGFIIPSVRIQDNLALNSNKYVIKIKDIKCAEGTVYYDKLLVISPTGENLNISGELTVEPTFGLPAVWIDPQLRNEALINNYTVIEPHMVIVTHLAETIKDNITELVNYSSVQKLLEQIEDEHKKLVSDLVPTQVTIFTIQKVLQNLLSERVSIKDLPSIIESIAEGYKVNQDITSVTEFVRASLSRQISSYYSTEKGYISVLTLSVQWEQLFRESISSNTAISPSKLQEFVYEVKSAFSKYSPQEENLVLLTSDSIRYYVRSIVSRINANFPVISQNEIHPRFSIKTIAQI